MQKLSYSDIVHVFVGQSVFMLQARFDLLTPKWKDYFAREVIRWLETHLTQRAPDAPKRGAKSKSSKSKVKSGRARR